MLAEGFFYRNENIETSCTKYEPGASYLVHDISMFPSTIKKAQNNPLQMLFINCIYFLDDSNHSPGTNRRNAN